jgi:hypothetical protein
LGNELAADVYVIAATKGSKIQYWAVAAPQYRALAEGQRLLAPGWHATLTSRRLTPKEVAELKMRANSVRELKFIP